MGYWWPTALRVLIGDEKSALGPADMVLYFDNAVTDSLHAGRALSDILTILMQFSK